MLIIYNGKGNYHATGSHFASARKAYHATLAIRKEDIFINLIEVKKENWSFGNGIAQYAE
jgi:hypothetical protein